MKLAVFDFDGTLTTGYISIDLLKALFNRGLYKKETYKGQEEIFNQYKDHKLPYMDFCYKWGLLWGSGMKGQQVSNVAAASADFFEDFKKNIFPVSYKLIEHLKRNNYYTLCLSIGAFEVLGLVAKELGFDEFFATELAVRDRIYTGEIITDFHKPEGKENRLKKFMQKKDINLHHSVGFGDSISDVGFMNMVEIPIVLNPSNDLSEYAQEKNWPILDLNKLKPDEVLNKIAKIISQYN